MSIFGRRTLGAHLIQIYCGTVEAAQPSEAQSLKAFVSRPHYAALNSAHFKGNVVGKFDVDVELRISGRPNTLESLFISGYNGAFSLN